jgi:hypothetical protein
MRFAILAVAPAVATLAHALTSQRCGVPRISGDVAHGVQGWPFSPSYFLFQNLATIWLKP